MCVCVYMFLYVYVILCEYACMVFAVQFDELRADVFGCSLKEYLQEMQVLDAEVAV